MVQIYNFFCACELGFSVIKKEEGYKFGFHYYYNIPQTYTHKVFVTIGVITQIRGMVTQLIFFVFYFEKSRK